MNCFGQNQSNFSGKNEQQTFYVWGVACSPSLHQPIHTRASVPVPFFPVQRRALSAATASSATASCASSVCGAGTMSTRARPWRTRPRRSPTRTASCPGPNATLLGPCGCSIFLTVVGHKFYTFFLQCTVPKAVGACRCPAFRNTNLLRPTGVVILSFCPFLVSRCICNLPLKHWPTVASYFVVLLSWLFLHSHIISIPSCSSFLLALLLLSKLFRYWQRCQCSSLFWAPKKVVQKHSRLMENKKRETIGIRRSLATQKSCEFM